MSNKKYRCYLRIEDYTESGPYKDSGWHTGPHNSSTGRPGPPYDFVEEYKSKYGVDPRFGFKNWKQAKRWFRSREMRALYNMGYRWRWYEGCNVVELKRHVAFCPIGKHKHHKGP